MHIIWSPKFPGSGGHRWLPRTLHCADSAGYCPELLGRLAQRVHRMRRYLETCGQCSQLRVVPSRASAGRPDQLGSFRRERLRAMVSVAWFALTLWSRVNIMAWLRGLLPGGAGRRLCVMAQCSLTRLRVADVLCSLKPVRKTSSRTCGGGICGAWGRCATGWRESCSVRLATCFCRSAIVDTMADI